MQGDCDARITGMGAAELIFYKPYIGFTFSPQTNAGEGYFKDGFAEVYYLSDKEWRKNIYSYPPIGTGDSGAYTTAYDLLFVN